MEDNQEEQILLGGVGGRKDRGAGRKPWLQGRDWLCSTEGGGGD